MLTKVFSVAVLMMGSVSCGDGDTASSGDGVEDDPCSYNTDCQSPLICDVNGTKKCVVCIVGDSETCPSGKVCVKDRCEAERPTCDNTPGSCAKLGYTQTHCEEGVCVPDCVADADCCTYEEVDVDGEMVWQVLAGEDCADYACRTDDSGICDRTKWAPDCAFCETTLGGWDCHEGTSVFSCSLGNACLRTDEDCAPDQLLCIENHCGSCRSASDCQGLEVCDGGVCRVPDPDPANPADLCSSDSSCDDMDSAGVDAYCSTQLSPRQCTVSCDGVASNPGQENAWCSDLDLGFSKCNDDECE